MCITDSLCCTAESNTTLSINYTPIKIKKKIASLPPSPCSLPPSLPHSIPPFLGKADKERYCFEFCFLGRCPFSTVPEWSYKKLRCLWVSALIRGTFPCSYRDGLVEEMNYGRSVPSGSGSIYWCLKNLLCPVPCIPLSSDDGKLLAMHFMAGGLYNTLFTVLN